MRCSSQGEPIGGIKTRSAELLAELAARREPLPITRNGQARAVLQDA
jgi:hypothetical protein